MDQSQKEYTEYYEVRMKKYENNPMYTNTYQTEKALYELMRDAKTKEEYQEKFFNGKLNIKNAIALVKDRESARLKHLKDLKEFIRAKGSESILAEVDSFENEGQITTRCNELMQKNMVEISIDEFTDHFYSDFTALENIEVAMRAQVPDRWQDEQKRYVNSELEKGKSDWQESVLPNARQYDPNWVFNYDLIWEERHRRRIPVPDEVVKQRIEDHKKYRGLK